MKRKPDVPPEIAILLEKRETPDRRAADTSKSASGKTEGAAGASEPAKKQIERRRRNRRKA